MCHHPPFATLPPHTACYRPPPPHPRAQWIPEIGDFVRDKVGGGPAVLVGNSLGGYASLATAAAYPDLIRWVRQV